MKRILMAIALPATLISLMAFSNPTAEVGLATYYNDNFQGRKVACEGQTYDKNKLTAAHKTLPCGTKVRVTHLENKKTVTVTINDRGPYIKGQIISLSRKAAETIDLVKSGEAKVRVDVVSAPEGSKTAARSTAKPKTQPKKAKEPELSIVDKASTIETGGLYKMQVLKLEPKGFGVQVAGYSDYESVMQQVAVLQKNWFKGAMVFVDRLNGKPYYKIIMGPFFTKQEAESYRANLVKKYNVKGAFVVNLEELEAAK